MTDPLVNPEQARLAGVWASAGATHQGKVRRMNEDAFVQRADIGLWAVADGMGGHQAGDVASHMIVEALGSMGPMPSLSARMDEIDQALDAVNQELVRRGEASAKGIMGSTVVVLALDPRGLGGLMWAGDSRIYRYRKHRLEQLSTDHSQVEEYIEQGLISREQAVGHPESNVITRALGSHPDEVLDADLIDIANGDRFLLCSDGLMRHLVDREIAEFLAHGDATAACRRLLECTLERGSADNTTIVVVDITDEC